MARLPDMVRDALEQDFELADELGSGGMAVVLRARERSSGRDVAIKVLRPEIARLLGPDRFDREIRILSRLAHPHIVPLLSSGRAADLPYLVMPFIGEGASLRSLLAAAPGGLPLADVLAMAGDIAAALDHAHGLGIIHRDIKPENILLDAGGVIVADFGVARAIESAGSDTLSSSGLLIGTPEYMSPEQCDAAAPVGAASDIYAFGCVLYEMLAGEPPFHGLSAQALLAQHRAAMPPSIRVVRAIPEAVENAVLGALAKSPAARPSSGASLVARLEGR